MSLPSIALVVVFATACGPSDPPVVDAGPCDLSVVAGTGLADDFIAVVDGDPSELILGFQGFRMLRFALDVDGPAASEAEVSAFVTIADESIELSQRSSERALVPTSDGFIVENWLVFLNDTPAVSLIGREAEIEVIVRAEGCVGGTRMRVAIRDEDSCVDQTIIVDAGLTDATIRDAIACEGGM